MPRNVFGYARVSGAEQGRHGTSLEAQQEDIRRYCRAHKLPEPVFFVEIESAAGKKLERRVELERLTRATQPGDLVLATNVHRWSRDIPHAVASVRALVARGVDWISVRENIDASTQQGDTMLGFMACFADQERREIYSRTVGTRKQLRDAGCWVEGPAPFGYEVDAARKLVVVPEDAPLALELHRRARKAPLSELQAWMRSVRPGDWDRKRILSMLRGRIYLGEMLRSDGTWAPAHPPIVTPALWQAVQAALDSRRLGGRRPAADARTASWLLRGLAACALCGSRLGASYGGHGLDYYVCGARLSRSRRAGQSCTAGYLRVPDVDQAVGQLVLERLGELRELLGRSDPPPAPTTGPDYAARRQALERRRERTIDLATDGTITREQLRERLAKLDAELAKLDELEAVATRAVVVRRPEVRREVLAQVTELARSWGQASVAVRREIVQTLARSIRLAVGQEPAIEWVPVAELAAEGR